MNGRTVLGPNTVVSRSDEPVAVEVDGTLVMMSIEQGMYFALEGVGPRIWALLQQPRSVREMCSALTEEFDIDDDSCQREVLAFLDELQAAQLVRIHAAADAPTPSAHSI